MNHNKDKFEESFKKSIEDFDQDLNNHLWDRLNKDLDKQKKGFGWLKFTSLVSILMVGCLIGYLISNKLNKINGNKSNNLSYNEKGEYFIQKNKLNENNPKIRNNSHEFFVKKENNVISNDKIKYKLEEKPNISIKNKQKSIVPFKFDIKNNQPLFYNKKDKSFSQIPQKENIIEHTFQSDNQKNELNNLVTANKQNEKVNKENNVDSNLIAKKNDKTDSILNKKSNPSPPTISQKPRFAFSFTMGLSQSNNTNTKIDKPEYIHKDAYKLNNLSNKQTQSKLFNFGFDFYLSKNSSLLLKTSAQLREIENIENINYIYEEVPFFDNEGKIFGYFPISDSLKKDFTFIGTNTQKRRFIQLPIQLSYRISLGNKHEFFPSLGLGFSKLISSSGKSFDIEKLEFVEYKDKLSKKINIKPIFGMQYSYNFYKAFWLGFEYVYQPIQSETIYKNTKIKTTLNQNNFNFNFKFKF